VEEVVFLLDETNREIRETGNEPPLNRYVVQASLYFDILRHLNHSARGSGANQANGSYFPVPGNTFPEIFRCFPGPFFEGTVKDARFGKTQQVGDF
jgi:hypothetical protein